MSAVTALHTVLICCTHGTTSHGIQANTTACRNRVTIGTIHNTFYMLRCCFCRIAILFYAPRHNKGGLRRRRHVLGRPFSLDRRHHHKLERGSYRVRDTVHRHEPTDDCCGRRHSHYRQRQHRDVRRLRVVTACGMRS